ncbi:hypothetical protein RD792_012825 [Penstemon davidsonii]|uniref:BRCT domain-containing protein n=1 Tax=Penstemon davidsonii TaxID=160366 RepID=A0ABR0CXZ3_9LAMI|nr:hypothetical protein RD792_012825 [Penstemon davidsonii]
MSESNTRKRNLPSWMSSREEENDDSEKSNQQEKSNKGQNSVHVKHTGKDDIALASNSGKSDFSKLMEGIMFVLSGFVNPERGVLRSQMLEMGAEYQPDWNSNCTLLVCAFANTPKFKQVKADGGTVISKDWISECYNQRKLVDIDIYLLHAGKPWRRQCISHDASEDIKPSTSYKSSKQEEKGSPAKKNAASSKPEPGEIKKIAAEGILTCLQDAIDALKQGQGIQQIADQWACVPKIIEELVQFDGNSTKEDLCREAMVCKQIYELEFLNVEHDEFLDKKKAPSYGSKKAGTREKNVATDDTSYDSDATIEMTEEEIDQAYNTVSSSL